MHVASTFDGAPHQRLISDNPLAAMNGMAVTRTDEINDRGRACENAASISPCAGEECGS